MAENAYDAVFDTAPSPDAIRPITQEPTPVTPESKPANPYDAVFPLPSQSAYVAGGGGRTWGDYATAIGTGLHSAGADVAGLMGSVMSGESREQMDWAAKQESEAAARSRQSMTPAAQTGGVGNIGIALTEQLPSLAALGGAEAVGGPLAAGAVMAAQGRGGLEARGATEGFKPTQAELAIPTLSGFLAGAIPGAGLPGKIATGAAPRYVLGLGQGTATFGVQSMVDETAAQHARIAAGLQKDYDVGTIGMSGVEGGAYGLAFSGMHIPERAKPKVPEGEPGKAQIDKHRQPEGGVSAEPTGSDRDGHKEEAKTGPGGKPAPAPEGGFEEIPGQPFAHVVPEPKETGPAPAPSPVDGPDVAIAAKGEGARPSAETGTPPEKITPEPEPERAPPTDEHLQQVNEVLDKEHPRDVTQIPAGVEPPELSGKQRLRYGSTPLEDGSTLIHDRRAGSKVDSKTLAKHAENGTQDQYVKDVVSKSEARVAEKTKPAVTPTESEAPPPPLETPQEPQGAPPEAAEASPATPIAEVPTPPSEAAPEAPRAQPAEVEAPAPTPAPVAEGVSVPAGAAEEAMRVGRDQTKGFKALIEELNATKQTASPEEASWLGQFGIGRREDGTYGPVEAGKLEKVGEAAQAKAAVKEEDKARAAGIAKAEKVTPTGRILEAKLTPEEQEAHKGAALRAKEAARKALEEAKKEEKRQARVQKEIETGEAQKAESHKGKEAQKKTEENNAKAREVVMRHLPKGDETPQEQHARAKAMMVDARESDVHIPEKFKGQHPHSDDVVLLAEARARIGKGEGNMTAYSRFLSREGEYYKEAGKIKEGRRAESAELGAKGSKAKPEAGKEEAIPEAGALETHVEEPEEKIEAERTKLKAEEEDARLRAEQAAHEAKIAKEAEPKKEEFIGPIQEYKPEVAGAGKEAPTVTGKAKLAALRPKVEGKITLGGKKEAPKAEELKAKATEKAEEVKPEHGVSKITPAEAKPGMTAKELETAGVGGPGKTFATKDSKGRDLNIKTVRSGDVKGIVSKYFDLRHYSPELHDLVKHIYDKVMEIAGDVPVHFVTDAEMTRANAESRGVYISMRSRATGKLIDHYILLNIEHLRHDTPFHEAFHGATQIAINTHPELKAKLDLLRKAVFNSPELEKVREQWKADPRSLPDHLRQAFSDVHEFITTMMTRPEVQEALKHVKIPRELADKLGVPKWRRATGWEGFLANIRNLFKLGPRDTNAIEAVASITEQAFLTHPSQAGELMGYVGRLHKAEAEEQTKPMAERMFDPISRSQDEKEAGDNYRNTATQAVRDAWKNMGARVQKHLPKLMNGVQLAHYYGKLFTDKGGNNIISHIMEVGRRMHVEMQKLRDVDFETYIQSRINAEKFASRQGDYARLWEMSNNYNIDASKPPGKLKKKVEDEAMERFQKNKFHPEAHELYNSLPKEMQKQYNDEMKFFKDKQKAMAEQRVDSILDNNHLPAGVTDKAALRERIMKGEMTDDDEMHYHNLALLGDIREAKQLIGGSKVYAPAYRSGDFVVKGRYEMPDGGHDRGIGIGGAPGEVLPDHVREFDTRKEAHDYATGTRLRADVNKVYYAKDKGERVFGLEKEKAEDPARGGPRNVAERYEVRLQREHMEMHRTYADAERALEDMRQAGVKERSTVLDRRRESDWGKINSSHANAMEKNIGNRDDLSPKEKEAAIRAMREYELVHGSALKSHLITRRYVGGADYGHADAIRSYSEAANRHMVNVKFKSEMDAAMKSAEEMDKANSQDPEKGYQSSAVMNELRDRVYRDPDQLSYKSSPWVHRLMALSYMKYMFGPRHMMMLQTHPLVYSAPEMAGRHGMGASLGALHKAAGDLGGITLGARKGFTTTLKMIKSLRESNPEKAAELAKSMDISKHMLSNLEGDRLRAMQMLGDSGHAHAGGDNEFYGSTGFDKVDALMRQQTRLQDAQNRHVVGLSAFDLEYAKTGDFEGSVKYAQKIIEKTIGVHSGLDIGSAMKNPLIRSFMQFKHFPLRQTELMLQNLHAAFSGESKETQREAMKAFAYQAGSSFSMAGVHGLPIGLIKPLGIVGSALGITPTPTQIDDRTRRGLASIFGATTAKIIMDGASSVIPHMPNLDNMFSRDYDTMFGEQKHDDLKSFLLNDIGGAPVSVLGDAFKGLEYALHLDPKAFEFLPLPRTVGDIARAYGLFKDGATTATGKSLTPASNIDAAWRVMGFGTKQEQAAQTGRAAAQQDISELPKKQQTVGEQLRAKARAARSPDIMGITPSKRSKQLLEERQGLYQ